MILSVYATDEPEVRDAVLRQALETGLTSLFTSLHMPEAEDLAAWASWMGRVHEETGIGFWADISPVTFERLGWRRGELEPLRRAGVVGLRLDFGFTPAEAAVIAGTGTLPIAVNASTVSAEEIDALTEAGVRVVGWHNFYPRPGTGITAEFLASQSRLFTDRGLPVLAFVPGETSRRAPLHRGLPTLESHRHRNAYACAVELEALVPGVEVVCAEGALLPQHLAWMSERGRSGVTTLPVVDLQPGAELLLGRDWELRVEQTGESQRLLGTRDLAVPEGGVPADTRGVGSLQMDTLGRYAGEVHLMTADRPLDADYVRLGEVAAPYRAIVPLLRGGDTIRLVRG